jgi:hypothetical protein
MQNYDQLDASFTSDAIFFPQTSSQSIRIASLVEMEGAGSSHLWRYEMITALAYMWIH